jgi:hypothetical protein
MCRLLVLVLVVSLLRCAWGSHPPEWYLASADGPAAAKKRRLVGVSCMTPSNLKGNGIKVKCMVKDRSVQRMGRHESKLKQRTRKHEERKTIEKETERNKHLTLSKEAHGPRGIISVRAGAHEHATRRLVILDGVARIEQATSIDEHGAAMDGWRPESRLGAIGQWR